MSDSPTVPPPSGSSAARAHYFLVVLEEEIWCPVSYVRVIHHLSRAPREFVFSICVLPRETTTAQELLPKVSGLLLARATNPASAALAAEARSRGLPVVYDLDDYLWRLPDYVDARELAGGADQVLQHVTRLITPSAALADFVHRRFAGLPATLVSNSCDLLVPDNRPSLTAVMANSDFFRLPQMRREFFGALRAAAADAGVRVWLYYLSNDVPETDTDDPSLQIIWCGVRSYTAYRALLEKVRPDLGIVPLPDDHFSRYKSVVKFAEFGYHGTPAVFSRVAPYADFVEDRVDGWLTENTAEAWRNSLSSIFKTPVGERRAIAREAHNRATREFPSAVWRNEFLSALAGSGSQPVPVPAAVVNAAPQLQEFTFRPAYDYIAGLRDGLRWERDEARRRVADLEQELARLRAGRETPSPETPQGAQA